MKRMKNNTKSKQERNRLYDEAQSIHKAATHNRESIARSKMCGCYYCENIYPAEKVTANHFYKDGTAFCPICEMDTVVGDASGITLTPELLKRMYRYWF